MEGIDIYDFELLIFDRWGEVIWESHDVEVGWDGTYNGKVVPEGTYTWIIRTKDLLNDDKYILAGRGRFATILAEDIDKVPQTRRLYSGGGGSVRGYAQRFVGALDAQNDPIGGLSALELGAEIRAKLYGDIGGVLFVDAGSVSEETFPAFDNGVQVAAGFGVRYYSPAGPIRLDIAFPLNGRQISTESAIRHSGANVWMLK